MFTPVLPLRAVLLQGLFLIIAIAIESFVLQINLRLSRKNSVEYAISLNLFSTICGWLTFFFVQPMLSDSLKIQLINYIFFNRFWGFDSNLWLLRGELYLLGILSFLFVFIVESIGLELLEKIIVKPAGVSPESLKAPDFPLLNAVRSNLFGNQPRKSTVILSANAASYIPLLIILLLNSRLSSS